MKNYLVIAKDEAAPEWFTDIGLQPKRVHTHWSDGRPCVPPRVIVELPDETTALTLLSHDIVKSVGPCDPMTRAETAEQINDLYRDGSPLGVKVADTLLDLMAHLDRKSED